MLLRYPQISSKNTASIPPPGSLARTWRPTVHIWGLKEQGFQCSPWPWSKGQLTGQQSWQAGVLSNTKIWLSELTLIHSEWRIPCSLKNEGSLPGIFPRKDFSLLSRFSRSLKNFDANLLYLSFTDMYYQTLSISINLKLNMLTTILVIIPHSDIGDW